MIPAPAAAVGLDGADFVSLMVEAESLASGVPMDPHRKPDLGSREKDVAAADVTLAPPRWDVPDPSAAQIGAASSAPGVATDSASLVASSHDATAPAPWDSTRTQPEVDSSAKPPQAFSIAAMAFSDLSTTIRPFTERPNPALPPSADPSVRLSGEFAASAPTLHERMSSNSPVGASFSAGSEPEITQGLDQRSTLPAAAVRGSDEPPSRPFKADQSVPKTPASVQPAAAAPTDIPVEQAVANAPSGAAEIHPAKPQSGILAWGLPSMEPPVPDGLPAQKNVSNLAEKADPLSAQSSTHRFSAGPAPVSVVGPFAPAPPLLGSLIPADRAETPALSQHPALQDDSVQFQSAQPTVHGGMHPITPPAAPPVPSLTLAQGGSGPAPEPQSQVLVAASFPTPPPQVRSAFQPSTDRQLSLAAALPPDHPSPAPAQSQETVASASGAGMARPELAADTPISVTNLSEIRVYPAGFDPGPSTPPPLIAEGAPRQAADDAAPARPSAPPVPLTAEIVRLVQSGPDGPVTLTLRPDDLGTLRFEVRQTEQGLHIHLSVEQPQTLDLLRRQGDQLLADLRQAGFAGASLSFAGGGAQDAPAQQRAQPQDTPYPSAAPPARDHLSPRQSPMASSGSLDLRL